MKHSQDAEDVVSETVIAAYENIKKLKKEESFRSWIFTILMNQCKKHFKQNGETEELKRMRLRQKRYRRKRIMILNKHFRC